MNKDDRFFGMEDWETLEADPEDVIERLLDDACEQVGEAFSVIADRITWPIKVCVYRRRDIGGEACAQSMANDALDRALDNLDEEYHNPSGEHTEATEGMKAAALAFGNAVVAEYVPWMCEPSGEVIEYTREQVEREEKETPS